MHNKNAAFKIIKTIEAAPQIYTNVVSPMKVRILCNISPNLHDEHAPQNRLDSQRPISYIMFSCEWI
jgi:hypothetical protein